MVRIRLTRVGKKKQPSYRIVVADSRSPRDGDFIEIIGHYNPRTEPSTIVLDEEKARMWLKRGAQPTERVAVLMSKAGIIERPTKKHTERLAKDTAEPETEKTEKKASEKVAAQDAGNMAEESKS